jgi:hypothetical protein
VEIDIPEYELSVVEEVDLVVGVDSGESLSFDFLKIAVNRVQGQRCLELEM